MFRKNINSRKSKAGFTLLELIIVVVIIGVLASLALPRLFRAVERTRAAEAYAAIGTIRMAMERCILMNGSYVDECDVEHGMWSSIGIDDPSTFAGAHFAYDGQPSTNGYDIYIRRNSSDGGPSVASSSPDIC